MIGGGVAGQNAAAIALGMEAEVLLLDRNVAQLRRVDAIYQGHCQTVASNAYEIERAVLDADLVIGAVLIPGAKAPRLISNELVSRMKPGSVLVDVSIDQGGCFEDSRPTTHSQPTYAVHESLFYCVANMPGAVPHTSTYALTNVTLSYALELANKGWRRALQDDPALALGLNTYEGAVTYAPVAEAHGYKSVDLAERPELSLQQSTGRSRELSACAVDLATARVSHCDGDPTGGQPADELSLDLFRRGIPRRAGRRVERDEVDVCQPAGRGGPRADRLASPGRSPPDHRVLDRIASAGPGGVRVRRRERFGDPPPGVDRDEGVA